MSDSVHDAEAFLDSLPDGGPAAWSVEQIRQWTECLYVCHGEYHRAALRRLLDHASTAEHALRAAVIADLRGLLSRAYKGDYVNRTLVVDADSIELLIETLEAQQS